MDIARIFAMVLGGKVVFVIDVGDVYWSIFVRKIAEIIFFR